MKQSRAKKPWRRLPREAVVVTTVPEVAWEARRDARTVVLIPDDATEEDLHLRWSELTFRASTGILLCDESRPELAMKVRECCDRARVNTNTGITRSSNWVQNILDNVHMMTEVAPAQAAVDQFKGVPCFVVGAGPSLEKNKHLLAAARRKGIVIAVNAASKVADAQCVLSLEAHDLGHKMDPRDSVKLFSLSAPSSMFELGFGPSLPIYTGEVAKPLAQLLGCPRVATSGSGSTAAVALAQTWGCDPVVLVGQDLAFTGGRVYSPATGLDDRVSPEGVFSWSDTSRSAKRSVALPTHVSGGRPVVAWGGTGEVFTDLGFYSVATWLTSCRPYLVNAINATEGGMRIEGWEERPLIDVIDAMPDRIIIPEDIVAAAGPPRTRPAALRWWLNNIAPHEFLESYAMADVLKLMEPWRGRRPWPLRFIERRVAAKQMRKLDALERAKRAELTEMCRSADEKRQNPRATGAVG